MQREEQREREREGGERREGRRTLESGAASAADVDGVVGELRQELLALGAPHHPYLLLPPLPLLPLHISQCLRTAGAVCLPPRTASNGGQPKQHGDADATTKNQEESRPGKCKASPLALILGGFALAAFCLCRSHSLTDSLCYSTLSLSLSPSLSQLASKEKSKGRKGKRKGNCCW